QPLLVGGQRRGGAALLRELLRQLRQRLLLRRLVGGPRVARRLLRLGLREQRPDVVVGVLPLRLQVFRAAVQGAELGGLRPRREQQVGLVQQRRDRRVARLPGADGIAIDVLVEQHGGPTERRLPRGD